MDAKDKDGVSKYSDLILWKEVLRYSKNEKKNIIFVTDDEKNDWWEDTNDEINFHSKLYKEFRRTDHSIIPFKSRDFYSEISSSYKIKKQILLN